jgi:hypothetical protein
VCDRPNGQWGFRLSGLCGYVYGAPVAVPCLRDASPAASTEPLPLTFAAESALMARVRQLPLVGRLLPARQVVSWHAIATDRLRLQVGASLLCASQPAYQCVEAQLLDAAP